MLPEWACSQWGGYNHDWLDCYRCLKNYEKYVENQKEKYVENQKENKNEKGEKPVRSNNN